MKKLMMIVAMMVAAISANAQVYVGGSLGFQTKKTSTDLGNNATADVTWSQFSIMPEIGYVLNEKTAVGIALGFTSTDDKDANKKESTSFKIAPYFRYTFVKWDKVSLFADAQLSYATGTTTTYIPDPNDPNKEVKSDADTNTFGISVRPGIAYQASDKISLVAHLGSALGYEHEKLSDTQTRNTFSILNVNSLGLSIGAYYNF